MDIFKQFENLYLSPKALARKGLDQLVEMIADTNSELQTAYAEIPSAIRHMSEAERLYNLALKQFKDAEYDQCKYHVESAVIRLRIAALTLQSAADEALEPDFSNDSAEFLVDLLLDSVAKTKLSVENNDLQVSAKLQDRLRRVVKISKSAILALKESEPDDPRWLANAGMLLLHLVVLFIEVENNEPMAHLQLANRPGNSFYVPLKQFIENLVDCRKLFLQRGETLAPRAEKHFDEAEQYFDQCLECYLEADFDEFEINITAGNTELKLAKELAARGAAKMVAEEEKPQEEKSAKALTKEFNLVAFRLKKLARKLGVRDFEIFEKRVDAASDYYHRAVEALDSKIFSEAQRLARAAFLDIDFARQIALSKKKPEYREF